MCVGACRGQKKVSDSPELELTGSGEQLSTGAGNSVLLKSSQRS